MSDLDAIVVGGGIFGRTIALALFIEGRDVMVIDDRRPDSGSAPSACLMNPRWFRDLGRDVYDPSLELLDSLFGVEELSFTRQPSGKEEPVFRVPTKKILCCHGYHEMFGTVTGICHDVSARKAPPSVLVKVKEIEGDHILKATLVVVAAGVWCGELMKVDGLVGKKGVAFTWHGQVANIIKPWAPYKQVVIFSRGDCTMWGGDGAAIKPENWSEKRQEQAMERVMSLANIRGKPFTLKATTGIRPYIPGVKPCLLEERAPGLWLATGGAKNGTIAAGWAASEILRRTS